MHITIFVFCLQKLQMLENEHSCHQKMIRDPPFNKSGTDTIYQNVPRESVREVGGQNEEHSPS